MCVKSRVLMIYFCAEADILDYNVDGINLLTDLHSQIQHMGARREYSRSKTH